MTQRDRGCAGFEGGGFAFTEARVEHACRLVAEGRIDVDRWGRRAWTDAETRGLRLVAGRTGGVFAYLGRVKGAVVRRTIGPAGVVRVAEARAWVERARFDETAAAALAPRPRGSSARSGGGHGEPTVGAVVADYLLAHASGRFLPGRRKSAPTRRTIEFYEAVYAATLKAQFAASPLSALAASFPATYAALSERAPYQANRMLQLARNVFGYAAGVGIWSEPNPAVDTGAGQRVVRNREQHRERYLTDAESARLDKALAADLPLWRDLFTTSIVTGQRMGACRRMLWADLELSGRSPCWRIPRAEMKGRKGGHVVPLSGALLALLRERHAAAGPKAEWVFPDDTGAGPVSSYDKAWRRIIKRAGLWSDDRERRPRPHDLRRTCGARMTAAGVPLPVVTRALGDAPSSVAMVAKVYAQVTDDALREAFKKVAPPSRRGKR